MNPSLILNPVNLHDQNNYFRLNSSNESLNTNQENNSNLQKKDIVIQILFHILMTILLILNLIEILISIENNSEKLAFMNFFSIIIKIVFLLYLILDLKNVLRSSYWSEIIFYLISIFFILLLDIFIFSEALYLYYNPVH
ncbi:hypothetical protein CWI37_0242p0020 [Hamiltosporidium tvaerminnensis]|uniref:Ion transport domain-containing protein n=1 Tax=Hamiltosporidium tvaerminnensis TaxID=1176355 RepID=A0A4Q9L8M9_9MICR|nr:hypothetical protein CWI37_0242p0020 [Hamiltosporidium tvaerminnensis]